jgi:hypothetical protein
LYEQRTARDSLLVFLYIPRRGGCVVAQIIKKQSAEKPLLGGVFLFSGICVELFGSDPRKHVGTWLQASRLQSSLQAHLLRRGDGTMRVFVVPPVGWEDTEMQRLRSALGGIDVEISFGTNPEATELVTSDAVLIITGGPHTPALFRSMGDAARQRRKTLVYASFNIPSIVERVMHLLHTTQKEASVDGLPKFPCGGGVGAFT